MTLLKKLGHDSRISGYSDLPAHLRSHPLSRERIDFISRHPTYDSSRTGGLLTPTLTYKFAMVSAKVYAFTHDAASTMRKYAGATDPDLYAQSISLFRAHKLSAALNKLDLLLQKHQNNPYLHELKGQFNLENGNLESAITSYTTAHNLSPESTLIQIQLAIALIHDGGKGRLQQAITLLQTAANAEPFNALIWRQMSIAYGKYGDKFASLVALAREASLLQNSSQKNKFMAMAKNLRNGSENKFINQVYYDLMHP